MRNGDYTQFIACYFCCCCLLRERSPSSAPASGLSHGGDRLPWTSPAWIIPRGCSFSWTALAQVPFHRVQSCRSSLLQPGCPSGSWVLPAKLLQCGLLSPELPARSLLQHGLPLPGEASPRAPWSPCHANQTQVAWCSISCRGFHN